MIKFISILFFSFSMGFDTISDTHLKSIDVKNMLGQQVSTDLTFIDDSGIKRTIKSLLSSNAPLLIVMAYYECPMLCSLVLNGLSASIIKSRLVPGQDFNVLTLSIDPKEDQHLALNKKNNYISQYFQDVKSNFWTFGVTSDENIQILTKELGFNYSYDSTTDQYAHPAVVYVVSNDSKISKQLFGIDIDSNSLRLSVLEAKNNQISSIFDKILLYCYKYNPKEGSYSLVASNVMKLAGASTVLAMGLFLSSYWIKEMRV